MEKITSFKIHNLYSSQIIGYSGHEKKEYGMG
jgi:hypothetical protein